jgi:hypothetical protein
MIKTIACCAAPTTRPGCVVVGREASGIAPSSALPGHALEIARDGALLINTA